MQRSYRAFLVIGFAVFLAGGGLTGCGETTGTGGGDPPRDQGEEGEPPPSNGAIVHVDTQDCVEGNSGKDNPCYIKPTTNTEYPLKAKVQNADGQAAPDRVVNYEVVEQQPQGLITLNTKKKLTEDNGVAEINLTTAAEKTGSATLKATTTDESLGAIFWDVTVHLKGSGEYQVNVTYDGEANVNNTQVSIFSTDNYPKDGGCTKLREEWNIRRQEDFNRSQLPSSITSTTEPLNPASGGKLERTFSFSQDLLDTGKAYTVWARSYKLRESDGEPKVELVWGCKTGPTFDELETQTVDIDLKDHVPQLEDEYTVTHEFDIADALPDRVERWVRLIGLFVKSPGAFVVGCKKGDTTLNQDGEQIELCEDGDVPGVLDFLKDLDFLPQEITDYVDDVTENATVRENVREVVDAFIIDKIFNQVGWLDAGRTITDDIFTTITNFGVKGKMRFKGEPTPTYGDDGNPEMQLAKEDNTQVWQKFAFHWRYNDNCEEANDFEACRTKWFKAQEFLDSGERFITANFGADIQGTSKLNIDKHKLTINFGALLIGALERVVFPRYFSSVASNEDDVVKDVDSNGDAIVTFDELFTGVIADCNEIADSEPVGDGDGQISGGLETAVSKVCSSLKESLIEEFKSALKEGLKLDGSTITLQTPDEEPCTMYQPDPYPGKASDPPQLPFVDRLGKQKKENQCVWEVDISFASDNASGTFYGETE